MKKLYRKKIDEFFWEKSRDSKTINQGGVPIDITRTTLFHKSYKCKTF